MQPYFCCVCGKVLGYMTDSILVRWGEQEYEDRYCRKCDYEEMGILEDVSYEEVIQGHDEEDLW